MGTFLTYNSLQLSITCVPVYCQQSSKQCPEFQKLIHPGRTIYESIPMKHNSFSLQHLLWNHVHLEGARPLVEISNIRKILESISLYTQNL